MYYRRANEVKKKLGTGFRQRPEAEFTFNLGMIDAEKWQSVPPQTIPVHDDWR